MGSINIPLLDFGGKGQPLYFAHANGYPPDCYVNLIKQLTLHYHVFSMLQRPLWPGTIPEEINDWYPLTDDFLHLLDEQHITSIIGIGHSMGGIVTLRAALHDPSRFKAIILIDPVLFPPYMILFWNLIKHLGLGYRFHPLVIGALRRRRQFDSIESLMRGYRRKPIFKYFDDNNLMTLVKGLLKPCVDGTFELQYSPEWEARIYVTGIWHDWDLWRDLPKLKIPLMIIRGSETNTFLASTARCVKRIHPSTRLETIERSTHLLPIEKPDEVSKILLSFLEEVL